MGDRFSVSQILPVLLLVLVSSSYVAEGQSNSKTQSPSAVTTKPGSTSQTASPSYNEAMAVIQGGDYNQIYRIIKLVNSTVRAELVQAAIYPSDNKTLEPARQVFLAAFGEYLLATVGSTKLSVSHIQHLGPAVFLTLPIWSYRYLSIDVMKYLLNMLSEWTAQQMASQGSENQTTSAANTTSFSVSNLTEAGDPSKISAICRRAFDLYSSTRTINSAEGWKNIKFLLFCAPEDVCAVVSSKLAKENSAVIASQPWVCVSSGKAEEKGVSEMESFKKAFPSNRACGRSLAKKVLEGLEINAEVLQSLGNLAPCADVKTVTVTTDLNCSLAGELIGMAETVSAVIKAYIVKKCTVIQESYANLNCSTMSSEYGQYLPYIGLNFFQNMSLKLLCDQECMQLWKSGVPDRTLSMITKRCYNSSTTLSSAEVGRLGALVPNLPASVVKNISTTALQENIQEIKEGLKGSTGQRTPPNKKASISAIARKMAEGGNLTKIFDSKDLMGEVSLKDLKSRAANASDVLAALGITGNSSVAMTRSQKRWVAKEVMKRKSAPNITAEDLENMQSTVTGIGSEVIGEMGDAHGNDTGGMELAETMCTQSGWSTKSLQAISEDLIEKALAVRNETNPYSALTTTDVQNLGCDCLLHLNASQFEAMAAEVCSSVCQKLGYCGRFQCISPVIQSNMLQACLSCKNLGNQAMTDTDFAELGPYLVSQMSTSQWNLVPSDVIKNNLVFFKSMCLNMDMRVAVSELLLRVIGRSASAYTSQIVNALGGALRLLPKSLLDSIDQATLAELSFDVMEELKPKIEENIQMKECCERWFNETDAEDLKNITLDFLVSWKNAIFAQPVPVANQTRKRRSTNSWDCNLIRSMPELFLTATTEEIAAMNNTEFLDCRVDIGALTALTTEQRTALLAKAKQALNKTDLCLVDPEELAGLGVIVSTMSVSELSCLNLANVVLTSNMGSIVIWTQEKLNALAARYKTTKSIASLSSLTSYDIGVLGSIMCGFSTSDINTIPAVEFGKSGAYIGKLSMCSVTTLNALKTKAIDPNAYGPVTLWTAAEVSELQYLIAGLNGSEIQQLSTSALEGLPPDVIPAIPPDVLKMMTSVQLQALTDQQAFSVTAEQKAVMSESQIQLIEEASTGGESLLPTIDIKTSDSGSQFSSLGLILLLTFTVTFL